MKKIKYILIITVFIVGCNSANKKTQKPEKDLADSFAIEGTPNYIEKLESKFENIEKLFPHQHLKKFDCSLLESIC